MKTLYTITLLIFTLTANCQLKEIQVKRNGTIANDFNNVGCLRIPTNAPRIKNLAIGYAVAKHGKYLVFATPQDGFLALQYWIENHAEYKLSRAMKVFAPKFENNLLKYIKDLCNDLNVSPSHKVKNINPMALMGAIAKYEGFKS